MQINPQTYLLENILYIASPNCDLRPKDINIELLVIHNISLPPNEFGNNYVTDLFTNNLDATKHPYFKTIYNLKVSTHCFIDRNGVIIQYVPFNLRAWHAGESSFAGKNNCNDFSIGIELEGADHIPYTDEQYGTLKEIVILLQKHYPNITNNRIVGHADISPGRKTDPGLSFNWNKLFELLGN